MAEFVSIEGLADAKRAIEELTKDMRGKVVRGALREAARPIVRQARSNAPVLTGLVKKRITVASSRLYRGKGGVIGVYIRPSATKLARKLKLTSQDPYYYRWQEAGFHAVGTRRVAGGRRNRVDRLRTSGARFIEGKKFMGRAFESRQREAVTIFSDAIKRRIDLANRRK
jgi:HK97 gp10 family phage protein